MFTIYLLPTIVMKTISFILFSKYTLLNYTLQFYSANISQKDLFSSIIPYIRLIFHIGKLFLLTISYQKSMRI